MEGHTMIKDTLLKQGALLTNHSEGQKKYKQHSMVALKGRWECLHQIKLQKQMGSMQPVHFLSQLDIQM